MTAVMWVVLALTAAVGAGFVVGRLSALRSVTQTPAARALGLRDELREALDRDQFVLHYQPKIELDTGQVSSLEALVRWQHPERGLLMPSEFVPVAGQHSELIESLTEWVLRRALTDHVAWTAAGHDWAVAVNVFAKNLRSLGFADAVGQILAEVGVGPDRLRLEVAQTELALNAEGAAHVLRALSALGVLVSIDDFGVDDTNLDLLRTLQVSELKIDPTLIAALPGHEADRARVRSLIDLGHSLGCSVTAEGVEWPDVADWLGNAGCDYAQGYLWLRPRAWTEVAQVFGVAGPCTATPAATLWVAGTASSRAPIAASPGPPAGRTWWHRKGREGHGGTISAA